MGSARKDGIEMKRDMKIDYYQVVMPGGCGIRFDQILANVSASQDDEFRNETHNRVPMRLQEAKKRQGVWIGDMVKIRMDNIPPKTKLNGQQEDLDLDPDEGLGEETAFLYDPGITILAIQRNRYAVSASAFARYFEIKGGIDEIELRPILLSSAMKRMAQMRIHRRLEISIASIQNLKMFAGDGHGVEKLTDLSDYFDAPAASIVVSMGQHSGTLNKIMQFAKDILQATREVSSNAGYRPPVTKLTVSGKHSENSPIEVVDLLEDRMIDVEEVNFSRNYSVSRESRQHAIQTAYSKRLSELKAMFQQP